MNHRTRMDWLWLWLMLKNHGNLNTYKICMIDKIRLVPSIGWSMQQAVFQFISRKWLSDKLYIQKVLEYYKQSACKFGLLFFPEGNSLNARNRGISERYS